MGALRYQQPRLILFHTNCEPDSEYWLIIKKIAASKMRVVQRSPPEFLWGKPVKVRPFTFFGHFVIGLPVSQHEHKLAKYLLGSFLRTSSTKGFLKGDHCADQLRFFPKDL